MTMRVLHAALAIAVAAGLAACSFTRPPVERATYDLAPARGAAPGASAKSVALKVKPFRTAPPYDGREFLYRRSDGQLVADFYNGFAAGPGELVTTATTEWLKGSGLFGAVLDVQVYVVRAGPAGRELVLDRRFSERVDLPDAAPEALAKGYNEALARILGRLERDLGALALKR